MERLLAMSEEGSEAKSIEFCESPKVSKNDVLFFPFFFKLFLVDEVVA